MAWLRLTGVALLGVTLVGCGSSSPPDNQAGPANAITARIAPEPAPASNATASATQKNVTPLPRKPTAPPPPKSVADTAPTYRAIGTEPFWAVTMRGTRATLERPETPSVSFAVTRSDDDFTIRYQGEGFAMTVSEGPCSDGMSDVLWSDRVQIAFAGGTLKGCGGERDNGWKDAP